MSEPIVTIRDAVQMRGETLGAATRLGAAAADGISSLTGAGAANVLDPIIHLQEHRRGIIPPNERE